MLGVVEVNGGVHYWCPVDSLKPASKTAIYPIYQVSVGEQYDPGASYL
jgi:hypothetical protein